MRLTTQLFLRPRAEPPHTTSLAQRPRLPRNGFVTQLHRSSGELQITGKQSMLRLPATADRRGSSWKSAASSRRPLNSCAS
jgi:hypothetical protein